MRRGVTVQTITVPILDDAIIENSETFSGGLSGAVNAIVADGTGIGTITDDDGPPGISIDDVTVNESAGTATFTVTVDKVGGLSVSVAYKTKDGSARSGSDFTAGSGVLNFAPGVTTQTVVVSIVSDARYENRETFTVVLDSAVNGVIADATGVGTVLDDDVPQIAKDARGQRECSAGCGGDFSASVRVGGGRKSFGGAARSAAGGVAVSAECAGANRVHECGDESRRDCGGDFHEYDERCADLCVADCR